MPVSGVAVAIIRFPNKPPDQRDSEPRSETEQGSPPGEKAQRPLYIMGTHVHLYIRGDWGQGPVQVLWPLWSHKE